MNDSIPTPLTDAACFDNGDDENEVLFVVSSGFARQLERENIQLRAALTKSTMNLTAQERVLIATALRLASIDLRVRIPQEAAQMEDLAERFMPVFAEERNQVASNDYYQAGDDMGHAIKRCCGYGDATILRILTSLTLQETGDLSEALHAGDHVRVEQIIGGRAAL